VRNTQTYLAMAHDDGAGELRLEEDRLHLSWDGVGRQEVFDRVNTKLEQATRAMGGTFVKNPLSSALAGNSLVTVHPLGGCAMADEAEHGVVDHEGRVFSGPTGTQVHEGLYVCDGAIIPRPLGVNPLLTIAALAERFCDLLARRQGWSVDRTPRPVRQLPRRSRRLGLSFTETMHGWYAEGQPRPGASPLRFVLTAVAEDLEALLEQPEHRARLVGSVTAPALSRRPLLATQGTFQLLVRDPRSPHARRMRYTPNLTSEEGERYWLEGLKELRDGPRLGVWSDTTTLHITLRRGEGPDAPALGKGVLRLTPADFARQLSTLQVLNARSATERLEALTRFGRFFLGSLADTYGGALLPRRAA
jgi:cholesterol oxidase